MDIVTVEFEDELGEYNLVIVMEAEIIAVDHGIGPYEYWGSKGYHTDIRKELQDSPYIEEVTLINDDGNEVKLGKEEHILISQWVNQNSNKIEEELLEKATIDC
tara:strand:- start:1010 stop:1321 length:312 start_codon:yes stop_codon:yes gene_type:complete